MQELKSIAIEHDVRKKGNQPKIIQDAADSFYKVKGKVNMNACREIQCGRPIH